MNFLRLLSLCSLSAVFAACINSPTELACSRTDFTVTSVRGDTTTTSTGLRYVEGQAGIGETVTWCEPVTIHYTGYLRDGTKFDSSRDANNPLSFRPGFSGVIDGVEQGVIGMRTSATRRLIIPPELGYGTQAVLTNGQILVPANSTLVFDIEIVRIGQ